MESVIVAGAGGFIGSHMVSYLKDRGYFVRAVDINFPEIRKQWWQHADEIITADMRDIKEVERVVKNIDWVFWFCSNMGGVGFFHTHDYKPFIDNMTMDMNILKSLGDRRLFYSSSACIYPTHIQKDVSNVPQLSEDMIFPANSDQMYGWEKLMMTMLSQRSNLDVRVGIFHTIYGEGQEFDGERAKFPPTIVKKVIDSNGVLKIWGDGTQIRTYLYIEDAVEKIYRIMTMPYSGAVNVAGDEVISVLNTAKLVLDIADKDADIVYEGDKPSGVLARGVNNSEFIKRYGYENKYTLKQGFERLYKWMLEI